MEDEVKLIERTDQTLKSMEEAEIERLNAALEESYINLEKDLLRKYPSYTAESQPGLLATQRGVLLANDLKESLILINPEREAEIEARFNRLLSTASKEGTTLGEELIQLQQGDDFVKATATLPIEAVGFAARDAVKRLRKHDEKFQEEASAIIQQGLIQGWGAMRTASQLRQRLGVAKGRAETIARTEIISAQDSATRATYKNNGVEYIIRIGTQDQRICPYCAARAGQVFPVDTPIALHPNDRCFSSPWLPDYEQSNPQQSVWIGKHAEDARKQAGEINTGRTPFEVMAGIPAAKPVWTPQAGYIDKSVERKGQSWAVGSLALLLLRGRDPANPDQPLPPDAPGQEENQLFKALMVGAAVAGVTVGSYYLARSRVRGNYKRSAKMAEDLADEFADLADIDLGDAEQITLAIGGFNNKKGQAGLEQAEEYQKFLKNHKVVGITNPNFETDYNTKDQPAQKVADIVAKTADVSLIKGYNPDAVRMAAAAIAFHKKHGKFPNLIGYSGGGLVVREAHEILKAYGAKDFKSISVAAPWLGFEELDPSEHIDIVNNADLFAHFPQLNGVKLTDSRVFGSAVEAHELKQGYLSNPEFEQTVQGFFGGTFQPKSQWDEILQEAQRLNPRDRYRSGFKQSAKMAEDMISDIDLNDPGDEQQITFVAGGFAGKQGQSGLEYAPYFKDLLPGHHTVGVPTPEFDLGDGLDVDPFGTMAKNWVNVLETATVKGRNMSSVRMAAMAAAHYRKYGKPVNLIGYSGGGMVAAEAHEILKLMGVPVKTAAIGSPWFGYTDLTPDELITLVGKGDIFKDLPFQNRIDIDDVESHWLNKYLDSPIVEFELNRHFTRTRKDSGAEPETARPVDVVVDVDEDEPPKPKTEPKAKQGKQPKTIQQLDDEDDLIIDLYPELALLSEAEIKLLPGRMQQKLLSARAAAKGLLTGQEVKGLLTGLQTKGLLTGLEIKGLLEGFEVKGLLTGQEVKGLLEGFTPKGLLEGQQIKGLLEGLEIKGLLPQVDIKGLLTGFEVKGLLTGQEVKGLLEGLKIRGQLTGRLDPKQLPAVTDGRYNQSLEALYKQLAKDLGVENDLKAVLRGELPQLKQIVPVELKVTPKQEAEIVKQTAQQLYKQGRSVERGMSRLAGFRIRQKLSEIAKTDLPMLPKLQAYRAAILDEIRPIASPLGEVQPPGAANTEAMQRFNFAGLQWYTPELKPTSASLDLMRKLTELDLPDEVIRSVDTIYLSRQKNAAEEYWRKRLKLNTPQVPGSINLEEGSITLYRGKANLQDAMRQAGYLVAYRKFGQLEPPEGSEYRRAMSEGRTITPYGFSSDAADFADSMAQFFLDPDRLKRFNPQRYNALSRLLNYRHSEKPLITGTDRPDPRGLEIVENLRTRNREISQTLKAQREAAQTIANKQRSTKKFQQSFERINPGQVQATAENALTNARLTEESLDRLGQSVSELEQRSAQILNPFNEPYFGTAPKKIKEAQRQAKGIERELAALDKATATAAQLRSSAAELSQTLSDLSTRRESLKTSSQGRDLELAWGQLVTDLDQAEQDLINLPRSSERAQALRDLVRMRAAIRAQESTVGVDVAALHRQAMQPKIDQLRALAENLEALQVRTTTQRNRLTDYQNRLAQLPQKLADLTDDTRARYNAVKSTKVAQSKLPQRVEQYRTLREAYTARLAEQSQAAQKITDDYVSARPAAINAVQAAIEDRLKTINDNLTVLAALEPGSVAWLVDSRNWELSEMPSDLAIVLARQQGRTKAERLRAAAEEVSRLIGTVKGSARLIEQRIDYVESIGRDTREQLLIEQRKWEQIRDDLADDETITDKQIQAYLKGEKPVKAVDVMRYGNQLIGDLEAFNQDFVRLLLDQEGVDPRTIMDQSALYRRARENFATETEQTRAQVAAEIDQALGTIAALQARLERDGQQEIVFEVGGRARTAAQIRAELAQAQQLADNLLRVRQVDITPAEQDYLDPERGRQRDAELRATEARNARAAELKVELAEVNREIQKRREAAERGQKRGISTDRLEAQQRRILRDIAKLGGTSEDE